MDPNEEAKRQIAQMAKRWPSSVVTRDKLEEFSGGLLKYHTIQKMDSDGKGIPGKFYYGRRVAYPVKEVIRFIQKRITNDYDTLSNLTKVA